MSVSHLRNPSYSYESIHRKSHFRALRTACFRFAFLITCLFALDLSAQAQTAQFTQGSTGTNTMSLQVPLGNLPGRGVSLPINLNYSSKVWRLGFIKSVYYTYGGSNAVAEAIYSEYATAGWTTSLDVPVIEWPKQNDCYWYTGKPYARGTVYPYTFRVARVFIHMPDGSTHELRKADQAYQDNGTIDMNGTFYAVDGSRMRYDSSGSTTGILFLADGTRYVFATGTTQYIDRNGNMLSYNTSSRQWTDTLGRTVGMPWPTNPQAIDYDYSIPGINGTWIHYTLKFKNLSDALTPGSPARLPVGDYYLPNPAQTPGDYNSSNFTQPTLGASMFVSGLSDPDEIDYQTNTRVIGRGQVDSTAFNPVVLAEIVLPTLNGVVQSYKFSYNNFGELDKVIYPAGAFQRYQYGVVPALGNPLVPYPQVSRGITSRWLSANGAGTDEVQWLYECTGASISVTAPGPTGAANGLKTVTYLYNLANLQNNFGYDSALNGLAYEERVYAPGVNGPMIRRTLTDWEVSSATFSRPQGTGTYTATRNARPKKTVSLILDTGGSALTSASTYTYDPAYEFSVGVDRISTSEYPFTTVDQSIAQSGAISAIPLASSPLRTSETTFLTSDANYRDRNILGLVSLSVVKKVAENGAETIVSQSSFSYDESEFPLLPYDTLTGWTNPPSIYRGNITSAGRWVDYPTSTWIYTHAQYDQCGSVRKAWDARDTTLTNPSQVNYKDSFSSGGPRNTYAFPTSTTSAVPDPTGTYGQTTGLVSTAVYDFNTGFVTSATDANGKTTTFEYNDPLNRLKKTTRPDGGWTTVEYSDEPGNTYVCTQTLQQSTPSQNVLESYQYFDKLGRSVRSFASEGATYLASATEYDRIGRVLKASNPFRTSLLGGTVTPSGLVWTTNTYDSLNRLTVVTAPDSSQAKTDYGYSLVSGYLGTTVTATDPALRNRKSITDASGRLIRTIEDPNGYPASPTPRAYQTNYTYDVLNNLRKVEQGSQLRYFGYDFPLARNSHSRS
jgi:YD repeat-containing protein